MACLFQIDDLPAGGAKVSLRPRTAIDDAWLRNLYASTREEEMSRVPWKAAEKQMFLRMQYDAQDRSYRETYPGADHHILIVDGRNAGRLILAERNGEIRIVDISLLPRHRHRGLGSAVIRELQRQASAAGLRVALQVYFQNTTAHRLYLLLGFRETGTRKDGYIDMQWQAASSPVA